MRRTFLEGFTRKRRLDTPSHRLDPFGHFAISIHFRPLRCLIVSSGEGLPNEIAKAISDLDGNKSCGLDGIYAEHLKLGSHLLFTLLGHCLTSFFVCNYIAVL